MSEKKPEIRVKLSKIYSDWVRRELEEATRDILEGRVGRLEELLDEYGVSSRRNAGRTV